MPRPGRAGSSPAARIIAAASGVHRAVELCRTSLCALESQESEDEKNQKPASGRRSMLETRQKRRPGAHSGSSALEAGDAPPAGEVALRLCAGIQRSWPQWRAVVFSAVTGSASSRREGCSDGSRRRGSARRASRPPSRCDSSTVGAGCCSRRSSKLWSTRAGSSWWPSRRACSRSTRRTSSAWCERRPAARRRLLDHDRRPARAAAAARHLRARAARASPVAVDPAARPPERAAHLEGGRDPALRARAARRVRDYAGVPRRLSRHRARVLTLALRDSRLRLRDRLLKNVGWRGHCRLLAVPRQFGARERRPA